MLPLLCDEEDLNDPPPMRPPETAHADELTQKMKATASAIVATLRRAELRLKFFFHAVTVLNVRFRTPMIRKRRAGTAMFKGKGGAATRLQVVTSSE